MNNYEKGLLNTEAKMVFIKHKIEWLQDFIENRISIRETQTGNHYPIVEDETIKISRKILKELKEKLKKAQKEYGERPFSDYMYAQATAGLKQA